MDGPIGCAKLAGKPGAGAKLLGRYTAQRRLLFYGFFFLVPALLSVALLARRPAFGLLSAPPPSIPVLTAEYDPATALGVPALRSDLHGADAGGALLRLHDSPPPGSLLAQYLAGPRPCGARLSVPALRAALARVRLPPALLAAVRDPDTLTVHVVCGAPGANGTSLDARFLPDVRALAGRFPRAAVLPVRASGVGAGSCVRDAALAARAAVAAGARGARILRAGGADAHLALSARASHLLLHRGAHSALGGLAARGRTYSGRALAEYAGRDAFRGLLARPHTVLGQPPRPPARALLDAMGPVRHSCCALRAFGGGDGEKVLCANAQGFAKAGQGKAGAAPCWVLSLGCGGRWDFERAVVARTRCAVRTFDCTRKFQVPARLAGRVSLHGVCLGTRGGPRRRGFADWEGVLDVAEAANGEEMPRMPAVVKMDIEGWEMPAMKEIISGEEDALLPQQIAMEFHNAGVKYLPREFDAHETIKRWFANLTRAGYRLVHRADNPYCASCSEITLVRESGLPAAE